jgi:hypothetical protein
MLFHVKAGARENLLAGGGQRAGQRHNHTDLDGARWRWLRQRSKLRSRRLGRYVCSA